MKIFMNQIRAILFLLGAVPALAGPVKTGYAPVGGTKLYYEIRGEAGGGVPLVLLHGGGSTIETSFGKVLDDLARHRQVIAYEQRGHGHSADTDKPFTFEGSADDAANLLNFLKVPRADFFGYSNGGSIAMQIAIRHPQRVHKLIVASAMYKRDGFSPEFWAGMKKETLAGMPKELKDAYLKTSPHPARLQSFHDKSVQRMLNFTDWPPETVKGIKAPTLILVGDGDVIRPEHAVEMFRLLPHGQLMVLPATNHMTLADHWPVPAIDAFLKAPMPPVKK